MSRNRAAKLTGGLLVRKGQARPADFLGDDAALLSVRQAPSLTVVQPSEESDADRPGEDAHAIADDELQPSSSLPLFAPACPEKAEPPTPCSPSTPSSAEDGEAKPVLEQQNLARAASETAEVADQAERQERPSAASAGIRWQQAALWSVLMLVSFGIGLWLVLAIEPAVLKLDQVAQPKSDDLPLSLDQSKVSAVESARGSMSGESLTALDPKASSGTKLEEAAPQPSDEEAGLVMTAATPAQAPATTTGPRSPAQAAAFSVGSQVETGGQDDLPPLPSRNPRAAQQAAAVPVDEPETGYALQLFAGRNADTASLEKLRLERVFPELGKFGPLKIIEGEVEGYDSFYRIRSALIADGKQAKALCQRIQAKGQDCFVVVQ